VAIGSLGHKNDRKGSKARKGDMMQQRCVPPIERMQDFPVSGLISFRFAE
jgi:hypothetical protein